MNKVKKFFLGDNILNFVVSDYVYGHFTNLNHKQLAICSSRFSEIEGKEEHLKIIEEKYKTIGLFQTRKYIVETFLQRSVDISDVIKSENPINEIRELLKANMIQPNEGPPAFLVAPKRKKYLARIHVNTWLKGNGEGPTQDDARKDAAQDALNFFYTYYNENPTPFMKNAPLKK